MTELQIREAEYWWQVTLMPPTDEASREYHCLRRLWGDHTMNTSRMGRGYYRWGSEDNLTPGLFQIWEVFNDPEAFRPLLELVGFPVVGKLRSVNWAYACEERIMRGQFAGVTGQKLIPDMVLYIEDDAGQGVLAVEVKKPGSKPVAKDVDKLRAYANLQSMRKIDRRQGFFLVGAHQASVARNLAPDHAVVTWEDILGLQEKAVGALADSDALQVRSWIRRAYSRYGIGIAAAPEPACGNTYASESSLAAINRKTANNCVRRFIKGSETVEGFLRGIDVQPPEKWMSSAPSRRVLSERKCQQTTDRKLNRWCREWRVEQERARP